MRTRDLQVLEEILRTRGGLGHREHEEFLERNPALLDRALMAHFYSRELILSEGARGSWTAPDLRRLPALA